MTEVNNYQRYNHSMRMSLIDKSYFIDKVDATVFVDYGCADGTLLSYISMMFPNVLCIGYDNNSEMIAIAKENNKDNDQIIFTDKWEDVRIEKEKHFKYKTCLILSSIIHEIYSYADSDLFWNLIHEANFDYIAIRDMCVSNTCSRTSDPITVARVRQVFDPIKIQNWESLWGSLDENWSLTHFFLTYRYVEGWEREFKENYLPISKEVLLQKFTMKYFPHYIEHYTLPFLRNEVNKTFGIQLQEPTHIKLIMRHSSI